MAGHALRGVERAAVHEVCGDAGAAQAVAPDFRLDAGCRARRADHACTHPSGSSRRSVSVLVFAVAVRKRGEALSFANPGGRRCTRGGTVRDCDCRASRSPCRSSRGGGAKAPLLHVAVFDVERHGRADATEGVELRRDQGAIAEADDGRDVDAVEELPRLGRGEDRRLAFADDMLRARARPPPD